MNRAADAFEAAVESAQAPAWFPVFLCLLAALTVLGLFKVRDGLRELRRQRAENFLLTGNR